MTATLIDDILDRIFDLCETASLLALVSASSHFNALAQPHLLHSVSFKKDVIQLVSFLKLITSCDNDRQGGTLGLGRHVQKFEIWDRALSWNRTWRVSASMTPAEMMECTEYTDTVPVATWAPMLSSALGTMSNLRVFVFKGWEQADEAIHHSPQLISTLLARPLLKTLSLGTIGVEGSGVLETALSALPTSPKFEAVSICGAEREGGSLEKPLRVSPGSGLGYFLHQIRRHITSLSLCGLDLEVFSALHCNVPLSFPSLYELHLRDCSLPLSWLAAAAPSIHTLSLSCCRAVHDSGPFPQPAFPQLVHLSTRFPHVTTLIRLNVLSPQKLRRLRLDIDWGEPLAGREDPTESFAIAQALSGLKSLTFQQFSIRPLPWWQGFAQVLPPLRFVDISLTVTTSLADDSMRMSRCKVPSVLAEVPLEYVSLTLGGASLLHDRPAEMAEDAIAISWAERIPALRYIDVQLGYKWTNQGSRLYWTVEHETNTVSIRPLSSSVGVKTRESYEAV